jgi:hypothetical protein
MKLNREILGVEANGVAGQDKMMHRSFDLFDESYSSAPP